MNDPRKVVLADEAVGEAAAEHCRTVQCDDDTFPTEDFIAGARFARDFYEQREAKWREYVELLTKENGALASAWTTTPTHIRAIRARALKKVAARAEELLAEERK